MKSQRESHLNNLYENAPQKNNISVHNDTFYRRRDFNLPQKTKQWEKVVEYSQLFSNVILTADRFSSQRSKDEFESVMKATGLNV